VTSGGSPQWVEREGFRIDPAVVEVARGARMVAAPTDDGRDPTYATIRQAAAILARQAGARVVLADRSTESRFVDPYGSGPMTDDAGPMYSHGGRRPRPRPWRSWTTPSPGRGWSCWRPCR